MAKSWDRGEVDMVFVDGDHSYEGCLADLSSWTPHIRHCGVVVVHDYRKSDVPLNRNGPHPKPWPGVDRAVDEFFESVAHSKSERVDSLIAFWLQKGRRVDVSETD